MCYKKIGLKVLVFAGCLSLLCAESKDVDQKMTLVRELENAHRGLDGYLVAYEAVTPGRAAMRIVVAMDKKSAISFLQVNRAGTDQSKPVHMVSWSVGGRELSMSMNGRVTKITSYDAMLARYGQLNNLLEPDHGVNMPRMASWVMLSPSQMIFSHQMASSNPAWAKEIHELVDLADQRVTWDAGDMGKLVIDRETGLLVEQKIEAEAGTRSLKMTRLLKNPPLEEIRKLLPQGDLGVVRETEAMKSKQGKTINALFFQNLVDRCDRENSKAALLQELLNKPGTREGLQSYLKGEDFAKNPPISSNFWKESLEKSGNDINKALQARGVTTGAKTFFIVESNREKYCIVTAASMTKEWQGMMRPKIASYILGDELKAKTENGKQAITAIEEALQRAYVIVMIDRSIEDFLKG